MDDEAVRASFSRRDVRVIIKFFVLLNKEPPEIHGLLQEGLQNHCPSIQTVRKWVSAIRDGREDMDDEQRPGRPECSTDEGHIQAVSDMLEEDRRIGCRRIADMLNISVSTAHRIVHDKLHRRKIVAKWVPHELTEQQRHTRVDTCISHLRRYRREGRRFLNRIITADETWVYGWEPQLKKATAEWLSSGEKRPQQVRKSQFQLKVLHVVFMDSQGILLDYPVAQGRTLTGELYAEIVRDKLRPAIRRKRAELLDSGVILLHDNARPHLTHHVTDLLDSWQWEVLQHPPYSPDLSPCDYFLFSRMKKPLRGVKYQDVDAINVAVRNSLRSLTEEDFSLGIPQLVHRWQKCWDADGLYFD